MESDINHGLLYPYKIRRQEVDGVIYYRIYKFDGTIYKDYGHLAKSLQDAITKITKLKEVEDEMSKGEWVSDEDIKVTLL